MTFLQSILLGLIQGVAEFLPISSSGHLAIAQNLLHINAEVPAFYDVLLHLGTLVAVFVAYWQDICDMVREFFCGIGDLVHHSTPTPVPPARRLILLIILGTLPLFAILPIKDTVEGLKSSMVFIGAALIVTGFLLFFSDRARKGRKDARSATVLDVLVVGVSQAIATVPGISRSGMTITTGCFVGFERRFAVRFSFLLHPRRAGCQHPQSEGCPHRRRGLEPTAGVSGGRGGGCRLRLPVHPPAEDDR